MRVLNDRQLERESPLHELRMIAEQAFSRAAGAPLIPGNQIRLLKDAQENYPAWLEALASARTTIYFESYIIHADEVGYQFADLLAQKAREGVRVRLIYDWFGARGTSSWLFWRRLRKAGVEVRCFNPPRLDSPLEVLSRDHRKVIVVDGRVAFVSGLCVGRSWVGDAKRGVEPWRDTGVMIEGPAVSDVEQAFAQMWADCGSPLSEQNAILFNANASPAADVALRIVATQPNVAGLYRLDQLIAAFARNSIWLTDAYFLGSAAYVQALKAAARDGVDVRLLLPRTSDIPIVRSLSRTGYRTLLEEGVRIFEWNGSMLHAKTAVVDGRWARVGSTNLNLASWIGNYEMDVVVEDERFARTMEETYRLDLDHSTEIVLGTQHKMRKTNQPMSRSGRGSTRGSAGRALTSVVAIGATVGATMRTHRLLGQAEAPLIIISALILLGVVALALYWPRAITIPVAVVAAWAAFALIVRAFRLRDMNRK